MTEPPPSKPPSERQDNGAEPPRDEGPPEGPASPSGAGFRVRPIIQMLAWTLLTLGLYQAWWLYQTTAVVRTYLDQPLIPNWLVHAAMVGAFMSVGLLIFNLTRPPDALPDQNLLMLSNVIQILLLTWTLLLRVGINVLAKTKRGDDNWIGLILTLLFSVFYLQYKINRILAARSQA